MIYRFDGCALDTNLYTMQRSGQTLRLRPKVFRVCLYLLEHRDRVVTREELCAQVWPGQFISQATLEGVIRLVRQGVGDSGRTQRIIQTLHGYGYRFVASVEGHPGNGVGRQASLAAALLLPAEASNLDETDGAAASVSPDEEPKGTPDVGRHGEIRRSAPVQEGHSMDGRAAIILDDRRTAQDNLPSRWRVGGMVLATALVTLVLVGGWGLWWRVTEQGTLPVEKSRIAVLPFIDLSADANHAHFADGMTEELIAQLARIRGLTVIARTSVMQYKRTRKDVATIGRELRVGMIVEGSVRRMDNQVRVSAQLIDVASQGHLWSQEYDREFTEVFSIQSDIATRVAEQLKVQLTAEPIYGGLRADPQFAAVMQKLRLRQ